MDTGQTHPPVAPPSPPVPILTESPEYQASAALRNAAKRSLQKPTSLGTGPSTVSMKVDTRRPGHQSSQASTGIRA